ncbi:MAG: hypothetical protein EXR07_04915 [Acetobacteraceae bacterium]|nr:hypothetical protein [Acetobacteraceae bacterium]
MLTRRLALAGSTASLTAVASHAAAPTPLSHIVVILRENHSFDNYFGAFPGANGQIMDGVCADEYPDPPHNRQAALAGPIQKSIFGKPIGACHYPPEHLPRYHAWARQFTLCDNYFGELLAPSVPNYFALMGVTSPVLDNPKGPRASYTETSLVDRLNDKRLSWKNYNGGISMVSMFRSAKESGNIVPVARFAADAAAGRLPSVSWITPSLADSEHPPYSVKHGEAWTAALVEAAMASPVWPRTAILIVWDEWGGFNDHVTPPVVESLSGQRLRYGYRVPCLVIGPLAKRGHVSHTLYSHASIVRTICRVFALPPLTQADATANDLLDCFTFKV